MPIYKEKEQINNQNRWYIRTYITDENGKKKQITRHNKNWIGRNGFWEAQQEENRLRNKIFNSYEEMNLNELYLKYIDTIKKNLKPSSIKKETDNYDLYIKPFLGHKKVFNISTKDIIDFHNFLNEKKIIIKNKESKRAIGEHPLSISYKKSIHITLNSILQFGCKYINLKENVARKVGNFKTPKGSKKKEINFLTVKEFDKYIIQEENYIYKAFYTILFFTGMRRGELLALTQNDINFKKNEIYINKSVNPKNGILATIPKTDKSNRTIKMLDIVSNCLKEFVKESENTLFGLTKIKPTTLQRKCDNNCVKAQINKNIRIHDFRHSFASMCIEKGVPIEVISDYLGHESISTTLETYSHLYPNSQDKLINILNQI